MSRILVTGAAGTVGRAVVRHLRSQGWTVMSTTRRGSPRAIDNGISIDLACDTEDLLAYLPHRPDAVVHLAAAVPHTGRDEKELAERTRAMDLNVIGLAASLSIPLVYASSLSLYGKCLERARLETDPISPRGFYAEAKAEGERLALEHGDASIMRLSGPVGPGPTGSILRRFLDLALSANQVTVWGSGTREQDFVDVRDISRFVEQALREQATGIYNVASGRPVTMLDLANLIVDIVGRGEVVQFERQDPEEGFMARYSVAKARALGWRPLNSLHESLAFLLLELPRGEED